jgi:hypothetical protein
LDHHLRLARVAQLVSGWVLLLMGAHAFGARKDSPAEENEEIDDW